MDQFYADGVPSGRTGLWITNVACLSSLLPGIVNIRLVCRASWSVVVRNPPVGRGSSGKESTTVSPVLKPFGEFDSYGTSSRFKKPVPVSAWSGILPALEHAKKCSQLPWDPDSMQEDCLCLDIYRPTNVNISKTLVWIHGGGYYAGDAASYDARELARLGAVVIVLQYRLGPFGFLPLAPNLGLFDQLLALQFVNRNLLRLTRNISTPIIVAGESAGGGSVMSHLASPLSRNLFSAAAVLSPGTSQTFDCSSISPYGDAVLKFCNCSSVGDCADASSLCLLTGFVKALGAGGPVMPFVPCVDSDFLLDAPANTLGSFPKIPIMIGTVKDEGSLFSWMIASQPPGPMHDDPARVSEAIRAVQEFSGARNLSDFYPTSNGTWSTLTDLMSDYLISCLAHHAMAKVASTRYLFDDFLLGSPISFLGPTHGQDLAFWFSNSTVPYGISSVQFSPAQLKLANHMSQLLLSFDESPPSDDVLVLSEVGGYTPLPPESKS